MVFSHGTDPDFSRKLADEHTAQEFAVKELDIHIVWLSRGKKQELGRADLGKEMGKDLSAYKAMKNRLHEPVVDFFRRPNEDRRTETIHISPAAVAKSHLARRMDTWPLLYTFVEDTQNVWHSVRLAVARE